MYKAIRIILTILFAAIVIFPILYALSASFFSVIDFTDAKAHFLPSALSFQNYLIALSHRHFPRYVLNSIITAAATSLLRVLIALPAAFALTHFRFHGKKAIFIILLTTLFIPSDAILYENYSTIASLHLVNTYSAMILPSIFSASSILMLYGALLGLDKDIYEAAKIDGARDIRYMVSILAPLTIPFIATIFIQCFITSFNSYLWPLIVTTKESMRTVQVGLTMLGFAEQGEKGAEFASVIIITLPFLVILAAVRSLIMKTLIGGKEERK